MISCRHTQIVAVKICVCADVCVFVSGLLLFCMVASELWDAETRPVDFVCDRESRRAMNVAAEMETALVRPADTAADR